MDSYKTRGIITRRADYGEANCMLTVMTEDLGLISACAYGVRSKKSKLRAAAQTMAFSELVLSKKNGDVYRVEAASVIDGFYPISEDLTALALANYIFEAAAEAFSDGDIRVLRLVLNTIYALAYKGVSIALAKSVFELKLMQYSGYEPELEACIYCGDKAEQLFFDFSGGIVCSGCASAACMRLSDGIYNALNFIFSAEEKRIFAFTASEEVCEGLSVLAEGYFLHKSEKRYKSLEYLKKII